MEHVGTGLLLKQLLIGAVVVSATVAIHAEVLNLLSRRLPWLVNLSHHWPQRIADTGLIVIAVHVILIAHTLEVFLWALVLLMTGAVSGLEPAVYFSLVCFTTLGFGDITLPTEWRFLSAILGANGFLLFGWSTAYMVEFIRQTR